MTCAPAWPGSARRPDRPPIVAGADQRDPASLTFLPQDRAGDSLTGQFHHPLEGMSGGCGRSPTAHGSHREDGHFGFMERLDYTSSRGSARSRCIFAQQGNRVGQGLQQNRAEVFDARRAGYPAGLMMSVRRDATDGAGQHGVRRTATPASPRPCRALVEHVAVSLASRPWGRSPSRR